ncbi:MAG TPA: type IV pilus modification protein PilV [Burkholderiales bacterium]|nr:type IV pilus modification protein PilV [Burkholderiales bacterium]
MNNNFPPHHIQGFTLLEVLIAIVVIAFGFLAFAGMQLISLRNAHSGTYQTVATQLAREMADNLRANKAGVGLGYYDNPAVGGFKTTNCLKTTGCTTQQMAKMDLYLWDQKLGTVLPLGAGHVCRTSHLNTGTPAAPDCTNNAGEPYAIKIWWDDSRSGTASAMFVSVFTP